MLHTGESSDAGRLPIVLDGVQALRLVQTGRTRDTGAVSPALPEGWEEVEGALEREFRFESFAQAIDFVNRVAEIAEEVQHHPDIAVHWNHVTLRWWTHTADRITDRDIELAARTNGLV